MMNAIDGKGSFVCLFCFVFFIYEGHTSVLLQKENRVLLCQIVLLVCVFPFCLFVCLFIFISLLLCIFVLNLFLFLFVCLL